jgi:hypothetical protein
MTFSGPSASAFDEEFMGHFRRFSASKSVMSAVASERVLERRELAINGFARTIRIAN